MSSKFSGLVLCMIVTIVTGYTAYTKDRIETLLLAKCNRLCRGEIENDQLEKVCTCEGSRKAFTFGKRNDEGKTEPKVHSEFQIDGVEQELEMQPIEKPVNDKQDFRQPVGRRDLLDLLNGMEEKKSTEAVEQQSEIPSYISLDTSTGIGKALDQLLEYEQKLKSKGSTLNRLLQKRGEQRRVTDGEQETLETALTLFKQDMGVDIKSATRDDFLDWVEKEMKAAEKRLIKLIKFYEYILATTSELD